MDSRFLRGFSRRVAAWAVFIIGSFLMLLGVILLLQFAVGIYRVSVVFSLVFLVAGAFFIFFAIKLNRKPQYVFIASFFLMTGFFILLSVLGIIPRRILIRSWPLISVFSGLSLLPAGRRHYNAFNRRFTIPSCVFIVLGLVFCIFSFDIVTFSFKQFVLDWWPLLIILVGITMVLVSLGAKNCPWDSKNPQDSRNPQDSK